MKQVLFLIILFHSLRAQLTVSILDFNGEDVEDKVLRACYNQLEESLIESNRFTVIDKGQREDLLEEQKFQNSGVCDEECAVEIGQLVGAEFLMLGEIIGFGNLYQVNIKIINIEKGDVAEKVTNQIEGKLSDLLNGMEDASQEIVRRIASSGGSMGITQQSTQPTNQPVIPKSFGSIEIKSDPSGANILIDGIEKGKTPVNIGNIESGIHSLIISYPGYERLQKRVMVEDGKLLEVSEYLVPMTGSLTILSEPVGAMVYLDNVQKDVTPCNIDDIPIRDYIVELKLKDYQTITKRVTVQYGENTTQKISLEPLPGKLNLFTNPVESTIIINNKKYKSNTSGLLSIEIPVGRYDIKASKNGYEDFRKKVYVKANALETIDIFLKKLPAGISSNPDMGFLSVNTFNGETKLTIPGIKDVQRLPLQYFELKYGNYNLKAFGEGLESKSFKVNIDRQKTTNIDINLERKKKSKAFKYALIFPGGGHLYTGANTKFRGYIYIFSTLGLGISLGQNYLNYQDQNSRLDTYQKEYNNAQLISDIDLTWKLYSDQTNLVNDTQNRIMMLGSAIVSAYITSLLDIYLFSRL